LDEFLNGETYVFGYLSEQYRRNIPAGMKRDCCATTISASILLVGSALPHFLEAQLFEHGNYLSRL
jgi:hypothetical protein